MTTTTTTTTTSSANGLNMASLVATRLKNGQMIVNTGYKVALGKKALVKLLKEAGYDVSVKVALTNSVYIHGCKLVEVDGDENWSDINIRLSNHTKPFDNWLDLQYNHNVVITCTKLDFEATICTPEAYALTKAGLMNYMNQYN